MLVSLSEKFYKATLQVGDGSGLTLCNHTYCIDFLLEGVSPTWSFRSLNISFITIVTESIHLVASHLLLFSFVFLSISREPGLYND